MSKCKYCENDRDHILNKIPSNEIYVSSKNITAFCGWCGARSIVKINYCPMCGRRLEDDVNE